MGHGAPSQWTLGNGLNSERGKSSSLKKCRNGRDYDYRSAISHPSEPKITTLQCEWIPARVESSKLLVVLHDRGDTSAGFRWLPDEFELDELNYLLVNAPDPYYGGRSWYALPPDHHLPKGERS